MNDALNFLPGVTIGDNGGSNVGGVLIRGYQARPTLNGIPPAHHVAAGVLVHQRRARRSAQGRVGR
ncbi:MAG: hypothetical protein HC793_05265 [Aquincola sp.]|nr:hypothetical protein [Aquincola sp.]